jgi:hypothetical protein
MNIHKDIQNLKTFVAVNIPSGLLSNALSSSALSAEYLKTIFIFVDDVVSRGRDPVLFMIKQNKYYVG